MGFKRTGCLVVFQWNVTMNWMDWGFFPEKRVVWGGSMDYVVWSVSRFWVVGGYFNEVRVLKCKRWFWVFQWTG